VSKDRRVATIYLPIEMGAFGRIGKVIGDEFPDAVMDFDEDGRACHAVVRAVPEGEQ
jgi:hypothetical protein